MHRMILVHSKSGVWAYPHAIFSNSLGSLPGLLGLLEQSLRVARKRQGGNLVPGFCFVNYKKPILVYLAKASNPGLGF